MDLKKDVKKFLNVPAFHVDTYIFFRGKICKETFQLYIYV